MNHGQVTSHPMWRAVLAWLTACSVAGAAISTPLVVPLVFGTANIYGSGNLAAAALIFIGVCMSVIVFTAVPAFALVMLVRITGWRRGLTDTLMPAGIVLVLTAGFLEQGGGAAGPLPLMMALPAALAGYVYWRVAGRPQPPYKEHR
jgi:hypothetical protein